MKLRVSNEAQRLRGLWVCGRVRAMHEALWAWAAVLLLTVAAGAATLPSGFTETVISGLSAPTAMTFAPDGRLFVCQQGGALRVIKNGALLPTPFVSLSVSSVGERGLLGVAFDPNFATNNFVYVYYTTATAPIHNRISRFTANGDVAVAGSEVVILDLNNLSGATNHNGGAIHFGPDGKLYVAVGENANAANAQSFGNLLGKVLRINTNPANVVPADNPYFNDPNVTGVNKAIWSLGLRNPFTFAFQPGTGRLFINDVGQNTYEEINEGAAHSNYGWSICEGFVCGGTPPTDYRAPLYVFAHSGAAPTGCAIAGGAFYNPVTMQFPTNYKDQYFFADLCGGFIRYVDPNAGPPIPASTSFATGISQPVDLQVSSDGSLWYLARGSASGLVGRIQYPAGQVPPTITQHPQSQTVMAGQPVTFSCAANGATPINFQWQRNNVDIAGATATSYTINSVTPADNGAQFRCVATNAFGSATSNNATLTVTAGTPVVAGDVLITEFRLDGPNGANDEFMELYNNTDHNITVGTTDGSSGWSVGLAYQCELCPPNGEGLVVYFVVPNGTVIPARGHFLYTNTFTDGGGVYRGYSLNNYGGTNRATGNATFNGTGVNLEFVDDPLEGFALFTTSNQANWSLANRLDAVGAVNNLNPLFAEGPGINYVADYNNNVEYSWVRRMESGTPQDTNNSANDFVLIAATGPFTVPQGGGSGNAILGAPSPENLTSPIQRNASVKTALIDPQQSSTAPPNRIRDTTANVCGNASLCAEGTLTIRRSFKNSTGAPVTALRFRIVDITTLNTPNPGGQQSDLRALDTADVTVTVTSGSSVLVKGTTIEQPPAQAAGGGLHSSLVVALPGGALAPNASVNVQFVLGVQAGGRFRFLVNVEALTGAAGLPKGGMTRGPIYSTGSVCADCKLSGKM